MARISDGFIVITDQGDSAVGRPVLYLQVKFPGLTHPLLPKHLRETTDPHECTVFKLAKSGHRVALELAEKHFPFAVPVRVTVTRDITIKLELPDEYGTSDLNVKRACIQLPDTGSE